MDEEAELLVELAVDDVEVAVLLAKSLHFSDCLTEVSEVQRIPVHDPFACGPEHLRASQTCYCLKLPWPKRP